MRAILPVVIFGAAVAACSSTTTVTPATIANDVELISSGLSAAVASVPQIPAPALAKTQAALKDLNAVAAALATADKPTAVSLIARVEADVNAVVAVVAVIPGLPPAVTAALQAAQVLLPVIEAAVGMVVHPAAGAMTPETARLILAAH